jgi:hypothetical protein
MEKSEYHKYLASREWALLREAVRKRSGGKCERCGQGPHDDTHHLTYERVGHERLEDLQAVCSPCHKFLSGKSTHDPFERLMQAIESFLLSDPKNNPIKPLNDAALALFRLRTFIRDRLQDEKMADLVLELAELVLKCQRGIEFFYTPKTHLLSLLGPNCDEIIRKAGAAGQLRYLVSTGTEEVDKAAAEYGVYTELSRKEMAKGGSQDV